MKEEPFLRRVRRAAWLSLLGILAGAGAALAADGPAARGKGETGAVLEIGTPAPDFELPVLQQGANAKGEDIARITNETIRLSAFRGKKVVCIFMSSYT